MSPPSSPPAPRCEAERSERGFIAIEWIAAMVLLLLPVMMIGAGVTQWPERQEIARAASGEAARAAVLAGSQAEAIAVASQVAAEVVANYGLPEGAYEVEVSAPVWDWGEDVTVTVTIAMPALDVPGFGSWSASSWSSSSTQRIEDYRGLG